VYCLRVNVYCTTATGWQPNCSLANISHRIAGFLDMETSSSDCTHVKGQCVGRTGDEGAAYFRNVCYSVDCIWNVMTHAQKPDFVFRRKGWVHLNRRGRQFSGPLAAEVCASAVVMLDTPCPEVAWRVLATHTICQFALQFPSRVPSRFNWTVPFDTA